MLSITNHLGNTDQPTGSVTSHLVRMAVIKKTEESLERWCMPVIPVLCEAKAGQSGVSAQPGQFSNLDHISE